MKHTKLFEEFAKMQEMSMRESKCMSETMIAQCEAMCEAMCKEMKDCHMDESELTAESYKAACNEKLNEIMKVIEKTCNEYMNS